MQKKPKGTYAETPENKVSEMRGLSGKCGVLKAKGRSHWCSIPQGNQTRGHTDVHIVQEQFHWCDESQKTVG